MILDLWWINVEAHRDPNISILIITCCFIYIFSQIINSKHINILFNYLYEIIRFEKKKHFITKVTKKTLL